MKALAEWGVGTPDDSIDFFLKEIKPESQDTRRKESSSTTASGASQAHDPTLLTFLQNSSKQEVACMELESKSGCKSLGGESCSFSEESSTKENTSNVWPESVVDFAPQEKEQTVSSPCSRSARPGKRQIYDRVDTSKRKRLLYLVDEMGISIKGAARQLEINYSTAKTILQLYRKCGRIERLPHHKSFRARADLKVRIFNPYHGSITESERRAKIIHKEKDPFFVSKVKSSQDEDDASFCTQILLDIAQAEDIESPKLLHSGAQSAFSFVQH